LICASDVRPAVASSPPRAPTRAWRSCRVCGLRPSSPEDIQAWTCGGETFREGAPPPQVLASTAHGLVPGPNKGARRRTINFFFRPGRAPRTPPLLGGISFLRSFLAQAKQRCRFAIIGAGRPPASRTRETTSGLRTCGDTRRQCGLCRSELAPLEKAGLAEQQPFLPGHEKAGHDHCHG